MHNHCERFDLVAEHFSGADHKLDFLAFTNHAQKDIFFRQHEMIQQGRELLPDTIVLFGMEWNAPEGRHACVIFPPSTAEADHAYSFSRAHDRRIDGGHPDIEASMARLADLPHAERPILFFNHPVPGDWSPDVIDRYLTADRGVVCGIEAIHGHQGHSATPLKWDLATYPGCAPGGPADHVYSGGRPFSMLANSDFHVHKQEKEFDYPLGVFSHSLVGVPTGERTAAAIFTALRAGRTCASLGHWMTLDDFSVGQNEDDARALIGDTWHGRGEGAALRLRFASDEDVATVDVIGRFDSDPSQVLHTFGPQQAGQVELDLPIPPGATGHLRLQVVSASQDRPPPGPRGYKAFFTSAILLKNA